MMTKTETVHTKVIHDIKKQTSAMFNKLGLTTSHAIMLFLTPSVSHNGLPFELSVSSSEEQDLKFAVSIATVDGVLPSIESRKIIRLYSHGDLD